MSTLIIRGSANDLENLVLTSAIFHSAQTSACSYTVRMQLHSFDYCARNYVIKNAEAKMNVEKSNIC